MAKTLDKGGEGARTTKVITAAVSGVIITGSVALVIFSSFTLLIGVSILIDCPFFSLGSEMKTFILMETSCF